MKRLSNLIFYCLISLVAVTAQGPSLNFLSQHTAVNGSSFYYNDLVEDTDGNVYTVGQILDPTVSGCIGGMPIAKYDSSGSLLWTNAYQMNSGVCEEKANAVVFDANTNKLIIGGTEDDKAFLGFFSPTNGNFSSKVSIQGEWSNIKGLYLKNDVIYATGYYTNQITFDNSITLSGSNKSNIFVATFDLNGNIINAVGGTGIGNMGGYDIVVDGNDNILISATTDSSIEFNQDPVQTHLYSLGSGFEMLTIALSNLLEYQWSKVLSTSPYSISVANKKYPLSLVDQVLYMSGVHQSQQVSFLAKIDLQASNNLLFNVNINRQIRDITANCHGIYLTGTQIGGKVPCDYQLFLDTYDTVTGNLNDSKSSSLCSNGEGIIISKTNGLWLSGHFRGSFNFEGQSLQSSPYYTNGLVANLNIAPCCSDFVIDIGPDLEVCTEEVPPQLSILNQIANKPTVYINWYRDGIIIGHAITQILSTNSTSSPVPGTYSVEVLFVDCDEPVRDTMVLNIKPCKPKCTAIGPTFSNVFSPEIADDFNDISIASDELENGFYNVLNNSNRKDSRATPNSFEITRVYPTGQIATTHIWDEGYSEIAEDWANISCDGMGEYLTVGYSKEINTAKEQAFVTGIDPNTTNAIGMKFGNDRAHSRLVHITSNASRNHFAAVGKYGEQLLVVLGSPCEEKSYTGAVYEFERRIQPEAITEISNLPIQENRGPFYAITGRYNNASFLMIIDKNGNLVYDMGIYNFGNSSKGMDLIQAADGSISIVGNYSKQELSISSGEGYSFILNVQPTNSSNLNSINWQYKFEGLGFASPNDIIINNLGNYIIAGKNGPANPYMQCSNCGDSGKAFSMEVSADGQLVRWSNLYHEQGGSSFNQVVQSEDKGYMHVGHVFTNKRKRNPDLPYTLTTPFYDKYIVKTDTDGKISNCECFDPIEVQAKRIDHDFAAVSTIPSGIKPESTRFQRYNAEDEEAPCVLYNCEAIDWSALDFDITLDSDNCVNNLPEITIQPNFPTNFPFVQINYTIDGTTITSTNANAISQHCTTAGTKNISITVFHTIYEFQCDKTFNFELDIVPCSDSTACVELVEESIECNPNNPYEYFYTFQVKNNSPNTASSLLLQNLPTGYGFSFCNSSAPVPSILLPLNPALAAGATSNSICIKIIATTPILNPTDICFNLSLLDHQSQNCCSALEEVCIQLASCCDPCEDKEIIIEKIDNLRNDSLGECCKKLDIINDCPYELYTKVETEIITPGVYFGYHALGGPNANDWAVFNASNTSITWTPIATNYIPSGTIDDLIQFCLDDINDAAEVPQEVVLKWYGTVNGKDSVLCRDTIQLACEMDFECVKISEPVISCDSTGTKYNYTFNVTNVSGVTFGATNLIVNIDPNTNLRFSPAGGIFSLPPNFTPGSSTTISTCIESTNGIFPPATNQLALNYHLAYMDRNGSIDTCCFENIVDTLELPSCRKSQACNVSLDFDGVGDYVQTNNPIAGNVNFTVEAWFLSEDTDGLTGCINNFERLMAFGGRARFEIGTCVNAFAIYIAGQGGVITGRTNVVDGQWHHVAITRNNNQVLVYIDGVLDITRNLTRPLDLGTIFRLGRWHGGVTGQEWAGQIDEVRIWNHPRTLSEILATKDHCLNGNETGLITYYNFNEGNGNVDNTAINTISDLSPTGNHGTLYNFDLVGDNSNFLNAVPFETDCNVPCKTTNSGGKILPINNNWETKLSNALLEIAPNPFYQTASVSYYLPEASTVGLAIRDITGKEVLPITTTQQEQGWHQASIQQSTLPAGMYYLVLKTDRELLSQKLVILEK